jgi:hypothetical protein
MYIRIPQEPRLGESPASLPATFGEPAAPPIVQPASAPTLDAMAAPLLSATNLAYAPKPANAPPYYGTRVEEHYYSQARFVDRPEVITGRQAIDACLIGTLSTVSTYRPQNHVVLAFRGTVSDWMSDWANDFEAKLVPFSKVPGVQVHKGFHDSIESLSGQGLLRSVAARLAANPGARLYITGHSKGGALAHVAALLIKRAHPNLPLGGVVSFEAPRAGHTSFAQACRDSQIDALRFEYQDDIVPHVPPTGPLVSALEAALAKAPALARRLPFRAPRSGPSLTYEHAGQLRFVDWSGAIIPDSTTLQVKRVAAMAAMIARYANLVITTGAVGIAKTMAHLASLHAVACGATPDKTSGMWRAVCRTESAG